MEGRIYLSFLHGISGGSESRDDARNGADFPDGSFHLTKTGEMLKKLKHLSKNRLKKQIKELLERLKIRDEAKFTGKGEK